MSDKPIVIDEFYKGIATSPITGFGNIRCLNVSDVPGVVYPNKKLALSSSVMTDRPIAGKYFSGYHIVDDSGVLYKKGLTSWSSVATSFATGRLDEWKNYLVGAKATYLNVIDSLGNDSNISGITSNSHQMCIVGDDDVLYIVGGNNITSVTEVDGKTFDPADSSTFTINTSALDLPEGVVATSVTKRLGELIIGTYDGSIYTWNKTSTSFNRPIHATESNVRALITINNTVYAQIGIYGNWYYFDGVRINLFKKMPQYIVSAFHKDKSHLNPEAVVEVDNKIYFGLQTSTYVSNTGIYSLDLENGAIVCEQELSQNNDDDTVIGCIVKGMQGDDDYIVGFEDATNSVFGVDEISTLGYSSDEAYLETPFMLLSTGNGQTYRIPEIILGEPLEALSSIKVYYRESLGDSWTLLETIDAENTKRKVLKGLKEYKTAQLKLVLNKNAKLINIILR